MLRMINYDEKDGAIKHIYDDDDDDADDDADDENGDDANDTVVGEEKNE